VEPELATDLAICFLSRPDSVPHTRRCYGRAACGDPERVRLLMGGLVVQDGR
jgi:hypothetical protein